MLSIIVFVVQIWLFGALALYLHYRSEDYGFAPLLFFVAGIMGVFNIIELMTLFVEPTPDIVIRPGGHVFVPIILLIVLIVYVTSGTRTARITIAGLIGIDILVLGVVFFLLLYLKVREPSTVVRGILADENILTPLFIRGVVASIIAFTANMLVIIIVFQGIKNAFPAFPESLIPGIALLIALWVDAVLYNILAFLGTSQFVPGIPGDVVMKTLAGLLLAPLAGWYLTRVAPTMTRYVGANNRSTLAILSGDGEFALRIVRLENELQASRAIYEQIIQHIEEVFWLADIEKKRLLYLSPNFEKFTGKPPESFYENPEALLNLIPPEDRTDDVMRQIFAPETEFRIQRADGSIRWLRNRSFPIAMQGTEVVRYAGITEDVTLRREAKLQAFALELSREKMNLLHRFIRDASHDLRTPLTAILLKLGLIQKVDADRQKTLVAELYAAAQHLNQLIDDLFTLSRIEGEEQAPKTVLDFNDIVQQVSQSEQVMAQDKHLNLDLHLADGTLPIVGDSDQLYRLVANLVGNAIHYTAQGTVTVRTLPEDNQVVLEVADTGVGIPEAHLNDIFERFYRTDEARIMRQDGTGLGLAISKAIVEQHQGTISVQSIVGQGTTFRVALPITGPGCA